MAGVMDVHRSEEGDTQISVGEHLPEALKEKGYLLLTK